MVVLSWGAQRTENWAWETFWQPNDSSLSQLRRAGRPACTPQVVACVCRPCPDCTSRPGASVAAGAVWTQLSSSSCSQQTALSDCHGFTFFFFFAVNVHYFLFVELKWPSHIQAKLKVFFNFAWICDGHFTVNYIKIVLMLSHMVFSYGN